jgi:hypothetical protein
MALSPREILQHMEVPPHGKGHPWPGAKGIYILGSLEPVRISLYSQQVRAFNLIYALVCEERLKKGTRVAIIGAGPAGLAAARAASHFGAHCFVFEKSERPMDVFCPGGKGNRRRFVHPSMENWPFPGSENDTANRLPFPKWKAGDPKSVADQIMEDLRNSPGRDLVELHLKVSARIDYAGRNWAIDYASKKWDWSQSKLEARSPGNLSNIQILIVAIGFGADKATEEATGYWDDDGDLWKGMRQHGGSVLVSGDGDGAIIEVVNAAVGQLDSHKRLTEIVLGITERSVLDELVKIERRNLRGPVGGKELEQDYARLDHEFEKRNPNPLSKIDNALRALRTYQGTVILLTASDSPYNPRTFAINRFLLWRFIKCELIKHDKGRVVKPLPSIGGQDTNALPVRSIWPSQSETSITQESNEKYVWRIHRHGTVKSLETDYPSLYGLCKSVLQPKNELDQTRVPAWPDNFFSGKAIASSMVAPPNRSGARIIPVGSEQELAKFKSISCIETFSPFMRGDQGESFWIRCKAEIIFDVEKIPDKGFSLEHRLTPTSPFRFLLTLDESKLINRRILAGDPPWAVAYSFSKDCNGKAPKIILDGDPATAYPFRDATGFPIFGDMLVRELRWKGIFRDMSPHVVVEQNAQHGATVLEYRSPIRRMDYEDGNEPKVTDEQYVPLEYKAEENCFVGNVIWRSEKADEYLPSGYFYGTRWDFIEPHPIPSFLTSD